LSVYELDDFTALIGSFRGAEIVRQWGDACVGKVGGKIFAILSPETGAISFKCSDMAFDLLQDLPGVIPAPYLARAKWVRTGPGSGLSENDVRAYIGEAHRLIAAKLTRAVRAELGLEGI
jgi:predicted DNA-binding protein (MmcQ/YjbR family)